jgi:hypothetical protein
MDAGSVRPNLRRELWGLKLRRKFRRKLGGLYDEWRLCGNDLRLHKWHYEWDHRPV